MENNYADCVIRWKDTNETENVIISLKGYDNNNIFFVCDSEEDFMSLVNGNGEDFVIEKYNFIENI